MFSDPVVGNDFFGRQEILDLLLKRATALKSGYRQNVAIIGHQQLGKTSILRHFLYTLNDPQILSVYVEIKLQSLDYFVDQFIRSLLFQYLIQTMTVNPEESLEKLESAAQNSIPKTVARTREIAHLLRSRRAEEAYSKLFELTSVIKEETGKNCIVILDEFHRLGEFGVKNAFSNFGKRIMVQKDTMYLLSSSSFSASRKILAEKLSLLFGNFERIYLENFDFKTSFAFVDKKMQPLSLGERFKNYLVSFTDGHPFFLETITSHLREWCLAEDQREVTAEILAEVFYRLFYGSQGVLNQYFMKLISPWTQPRSRGRHLLILAEIARGTNRLKDIAAALNMSQREASSQIQELMDYELLVKTGIFYRFHNKIFKFWLREVYERKELSILGTRGKNEAFLGAVCQAIREHEQILAMGVVSRMENLFSEFRNDLVEFGEKKRKLPHFTEFLRPAEDPLLPGQNTHQIVARGHGRCWICRVTEEKATEKQVLDLVQGVSSAEPAHTKVFLALGGFDENAKLLAKEKRVLTLGLSRVNLLMDLYGMPPIILHEPLSPGAR